MYVSECSDSYLLKNDATLLTYITELCEKKSFGTVISLWPTPGAVNLVEFYMYLPTILMRLAPSNSFWHVSWSGCLLGGDCCQTR
jgi:hypothetical protein